MERLDPDGSPEAAIAQALLAAPVWAKIGITSAGTYIRQEAAIELARAVLEGGERQHEVSPDQLRLRL